MDSISYRKWDIWQNTTLLKERNTFQGYYECVLTPTLMTPQTLEFLYENYELRLGQTLELISIQKPPKDIIQMEMVNQSHELCLRIYGSHQSTNSVQETILLILKMLNELSLRLDITFNCNKITFKDHNWGSIFQAVRRNIGRGMSFEVDERMLAKKQLLAKFPPEQNTTPAVKAYLAGINLLGLEDQFPGLLEAAFMQFYCGCEAVCASYELGDAQRYIANNEKDSEESKKLQVIAHQVWQVRNNYFGHGIRKLGEGPSSYAQAAQIAKQVLVARYLCRKMIELQEPRGDVLIREIGFYVNGFSEDFRGELEQLGKSFFVPYKGRNSKVYEAGNKNPIDTYTIPDKKV